MRTTLTLDDDLFEQLRQLAHERRVSMREILNEVVRRGLGAAPEAEPYRVDVFDSAFQPGVDPHRLNQLLDDLEVDLELERIARKPR